MRSLITFGVIAAFISMAFVTPSDALVSAKGSVERLKLTPEKAAAILSEFAPAPKATLKHIVKIALPNVPRSKEWKAMLQSEKDPYLHDAYESIDWAQRKSSIEYCRDFDPGVSDSPTASPTLGDLLALCLAKVSADSARCAQIDSHSAPQLKAVCETELVAST